MIDVIVVKISIALTDWHDFSGRGNHPRHFSQKHRDLRISPTVWITGRDRVTGDAMTASLPERTVTDRCLSRSDIASLAASGTPMALHGCDLQEADLSALDMTGWDFVRCDVRHANFRGTRLEGSRWQSCRGGFATLIGAELGDARFGSCDFNNSVWRSARLGDAAFTGCKLTGADLSDARTMDVRFEECLLIGAKLPGHSFRKQTLRKLDLSQADLRKADFRNAVLEGCSLRDAHLVGTRFDGADLRGADLGGLKLIDASLFRGATISRDQAALLLAELGLKLG
jgi:fluoroquinolone resistance protein